MRCGTFSVYGIKAHLLCATNRVTISYEITAANVADLRLTGELLTEANLTDAVTRRLLADLAYNSEPLRESLAERGLSLVTESRSTWSKAADRGRLRESEGGIRFRVDVGDYAYRDSDADRGEADRSHLRSLHSRLLGRPQGKIKELWA